MSRLVHLGGLNTPFHHRVGFRKTVQLWCNASAEVKSKMKIIVEEYENKPSIRRLIDVISAAR